MSRSKWSSRAWTLLAALLVVMIFASSASNAAPPASSPAGPPATGQAIPPEGLPGTKPAEQPDEPAPDTASDEADLFQTTETPEGVDSSRRESEIYGARIDGLQGDVDDLKERIFRSKARLSVLKETVLHGVLAGSKVVIVHRNLMGSQFRLTKVAVVLDGAQIYARTDDSGTLDQEDELTVLDGNIVPGPHTITVELTYQGQGFGVFSYLNGYTFTARGSHNFTAPENGALRLMSSGFEKGNISTEMKDRPAVDWQEIPLDASGKPMPQAQRKSKKSSSNKKKSQQKPAAKKSAEPPSEPADKPAPASGAQKPGGAQESGGAQKPAAQKPAAQKPAAQKPAAQKPAAQKPAAEAGE